MKKFKFRLQTVLKLRQQQEQEKKRVVGDLLHQINELQRQALEMAQAISRQGQMLKERIQGQVDVNWIAYYQGYVTDMRRAIAAKIEAVGRIQKQLQTARQELAEAARRTKILEKLKERQKDRYERRLKKMETRETDEIGAHVFRRARGVQTA